MSTNIFSIGRSALAAAQAAQATTSHNISNATVAGYSRQVAVQSTAGGINYGYGFVGQGTQVTEIKRIYNDFLNKQVIAATTGTSALDAYHAQIRQLDNMVADTAAGLSPALQDFFKSMHNLASLPGNAAARQSVLSAGQTLAARFHSLDEQMAQSRTSINGQIASSVGTINSYAAQIDELNKAIMKVSGANGAAPNDLLDQRDQVVSALNKIVQVTTLPQNNGTLSVFIANGQPLVLGSQVSTLVSTPAATDPTRLQVSLKNNGSSIPIPDTAFGGGSLGGIMSYRTEILDVAQNTLGRVAIALATQFNAQHKLGQDQNGALGTDFFTVGVPQVNGAPGNSAAAAVTATISDSSKLTASDYKLAYDGTRYTITRVSDGNATTITPPGAAFPVTLDGVTYSAPTMAAGDSFLIKPSINGAAMLGVAITNTQKIAAATPVITSINAVTDMGLVTTGNTGTGAVTSTNVNKSVFAPNSTQTYTYAAGVPNTLVLTPPAAVTVTTKAGVTTTYAAGAAIPYASGATYGSGGVSFVLSGTPGNADKFVFSPKPANTGTAVISPGTVDSTYAGTPLAAGTKLGFTFNSSGNTLTPTANVGAVTVKHADGTTTNYAAGANIAIASGDKLTTGGITFAITGQPANGDQFYVSPNTNGVNDNRNAQALNALQTANTIGSSSFQGSYSQMVSMIGNKTHEVDILNKAGKARLTAIQQEQQSESGVNQDEELANMIRNQTSYQAAAKIIQAASDMLNVLFTLGR
ncbi:flagellar hook-associated protein FlgK [Herbaspirillum sp. CF444]|uniref:flagellar hook-associated protein FlgK n=1 Tax=Herbaspirillum sp. CF444 TaxID=1144319 RepID=UPI0002724661|nr:flagellar hook-associated protein FlgK [Herbaspirillum sp. CF444]EJL84984.1 flagellar hook-associated protein FlgK [Herbaspirillum sp. CF444]